MLRDRDARSRGRQRNRTRVGNRRDPETAPTQLAGRKVSPGVDHVEIRGDLNSISQKEPDCSGVRNT